MAKAWTEAHFAAPVEHDLRRRQIRMRHVMIMHRVDGPQHRAGQVFEGELRQRTNRLDEVLKTAVGGEITYH